MSEAADKGRGFRLWMWLALLVAPVLYALSVGPAMLVVQKAGVGGEVILVYEPLIWLDKNTPLRGSLKAYIDLWRR
jgi:hypothetical protein